MRASRPSRILGALSLLLLGGCAPWFPAPSRPLATTPDQIVVIAPGADGVTREFGGRLQRIDSTGVSVLLAGDEPRTFHFDSILRVRRAVDRKRHGGTGALVGALAGGIVGGLGTEIKHGPDTDEVPLYAGVGAAVGAGVGLVVGLLIETDVWQDVPVSVLRRQAGGTEIQWRVTLGR